MDIEKQIIIILSNQKQLESTNKRLLQKVHSFIKTNRGKHEKRMDNIEENIRNLGKRIGNLEKQIERILLYQSPDKD